jgi:hypothetical protein
MGHGRGRYLRSARMISTASSVVIRVSKSWLAVQPFFSMKYEAASPDQCHTAEHQARGAEIINRREEWLIDVLQTV